VPLTNSITCLSIVLESCSNRWKTQQVFEYVLGFSFFVSVVISEVGVWPFQLMLPGLGPNDFVQILSKFSFETRLDSKSFEPMDDFLVHKNKLVIIKIWDKYRTYRFEKFVFFHCVQYLAWHLSIAPYIKQGCNWSLLLWLFCVISHLGTCIRPVLWLSSIQWNAKISFS